MAVMWAGFLSVMGCTSLVYKMLICSVEIALKVMKGKVSSDYTASSLMGEDRKTPGKGQVWNAVPLNSFHGLPALIYEVLPVSKVGAIPMPAYSCDESPGCVAPLASR